jgi:hypothetical protein
MDSKRLPIPLLSRPKRLGQPYHGLLVNGSLTLSTGATIEWPGAPYGDVYRFEVPGTTLTMDPAEVAIEAALGREWRSVALLTGHMRNYAGIVVGSNAWLYGAPDGTVWRIECDRLDNPIAAIEPALGRGRPWPFPETLDFTFKIRRFGVVSPDSPLGDDAPTTTRVVEGQSLGGAWMSDYVPLDGTYTGSDRRNVWVADLPWLVINIEDINSTGSQAIFGVNRSTEQSALEGAAGRASPYAWLRVDVAGDEASGITISMAVQEVVTYSPSSSYLGSDITSSEWWHRRLDGTVYLGEPPAWATADAETYTTTAAQDGMTVGLFFDATDAIRRVRTSGWSGSMEETGYQTLNNEGVTDAYFWNLSGEVSSVSATFEGGSSVSFPSITASAARTITSGHFTITGGALGAITSPDGGQNWWISDSMRDGVAASEWPRRMPTTPSYGPGLLFSHVTWWRKGAVLLRLFDGLFVTRVTNKVYAVVASRERDDTISPQIPGAFKVLAIGSPAGWVTGSAIEAHWKASYNPITEQLSTCPAGQSRGWV